MGFDGREVANFILDFCDSKGRRTSNLSLQKIVFFCHVWSLIELKRPLVKHQFEAWEFGPVLQYLYRDFKAFGDRYIDGRAKKLNPQTGERCIVSYNFDERTKFFLNRVVDFYSQLSPSELVRLSHSAGGPWDEIWNHPEEINPGMKIEENAIVEYYSKIRAPFTVQ